MNIKSNKFCLCLILLVVCVSKAFAVYPLTGKPLAQVAMFVDPSSREIINPYKIYGRQIKYYFYPGSQNIVLTLDGNTKSFDFKPILQEAMAEWKKALGIDFIEVNNSKDAVLEIEIEEGKDVANAMGEPKGLGGNSQAHFVIFPKGLQKDVDNVFISKSHEVIKKCMGDNVTQTDYMKFALRNVAKHELGHVLGFAHTPTELDRPEPSNAIVLNANDIWGASAPIMYGEDVLKYMQVLYYYNYGRMPTEAGGPYITLENIEISTQEAAVSQELDSNICPQNYKSYNGLTSSAVPCHPPIYYKPPIMPAMFLLLQ